ncbi:cuticle protein 19-like [Anabrus simplex]|uniref:cuticle protein 19-like n=1 Tax=Anabrus simplex TaxID=316456 RepID=UPI0034DDAE65
MFKLCLFVVALAASSVSASPGLAAAPLAYAAAPVAYAAAPVAYAAPAPAVVTAHSSQVIAQNFHRLAAPLAVPALATYAHAPALILRK